MILHVRAFQSFVKTNNFSKVAEYKINIQQLVAFLPNNKNDKEEIRKTISCIIAP